MPRRSADFRTEYLTTPGNRRRAVGKSTRGASRPTSDIWTTPPDPTRFMLSRSNHGQFPVFRTERQTWPEACAYTREMRFAAHKHIEQEELMFDQRFLRSRGFRVVPAAAVGIALAVLGGGVFAAQDKYSRARAKWARIL